MSDFNNALTYTDAYKISHHGFMPENTTKIYSNFTCRSDKHFADLKPRLFKEFKTRPVMFGLQYFILDILVHEFNQFFAAPKEIAIHQLKNNISSYLGDRAASNLARFEQLHDLGYLPIVIRAIPEGESFDIGVPFLTISNTHPDFAWLTNYLETVLSCTIWKPITVATTLFYYRAMVNYYAKLTDEHSPTDFQVHDFSMRGMSGRHDAAVCGAAFALFSQGSDTFPVIPFVEKYYPRDNKDGTIISSVPASEHSLASLGIAIDGELETLRRWITKDYPTGVVSVIADTLDFWRVINEYLPALKDEILNRDGKVVIRPDSGYPPHIIAGTAKEKGAVERLWDIFGGTINSQGFKVLNPKIGLIYGDSMTPHMAEETLRTLKERGFASTNVVFGVGSFTSQYVTRDTLNMALKATAAVKDGVEYSLEKNPSTDPSKKSRKGFLFHYRDADGNWVCEDNVSSDKETKSELDVVFLNGEYSLVSYDEVRQNAAAELDKFNQ